MKYILTRKVAVTVYNNDMRNEANIFKNNNDSDKKRKEIRQFLPESARNLKKNKEWRN